MAISTVAIAVPRLVFQLRRCEPLAWRRYRDVIYPPAYYLASSVAGKEKEKEKER